jgi:CubicO group peptidase (beta-lactamase class C family)
MTRNLRRAIALAAALFAGQAEAAPAGGRHAVFHKQMERYFAELRKDAYAPPGFVVVVVQGERTLFARAYGVRDVRTHAALTLDNPIYTGSTTKAYTGVLAAELDRRGLVPLSTSLKDLWPELKLPNRVDPASVTAAKFLSHSAPISDGGLTFISNETGEWTLDMVPRHLAKYARPMTKPFEYSNFGPFMYSVMVQKRLGLGYADALRRYVLRPMGLRKTSARLEDFAPADIGRCSSVTAAARGWQSVAPKPTPLLNAAGGIFTSGNDAAAFLKAFTSGGRSEQSRIPASSLLKTAAPVSSQDSDTWGFHRAQYGHGWDLANYKSKPLWLRAGVYNGCRAMFVVFPEQKLGIGMLTLSDVAGNVFNARGIQQAFDYWTGAADADAQAAARIAAFHKDAVGSAAELRKPASPGIVVSPETLLQYEGRYRSDRLGTMVVKLERDRLRGHIGLFTLELTPVGPDRFENRAGLELQVEPESFVRGPNGRISAMMWGEREFDRVD